MFARLASKFTVAFSTSWDFFRPRKRLGIVSLILLTSLVTVFWLVSTKIVHADFIPSADHIMKWFAEILLALAGFCIKLTFFVLKFIIEVAGYNGFIDSPAVTVGWVMIRDITNMLFVVVLLAIAFGTILGIDSYEYKHSLVKLIGAAILVNFSRVICGLIIDVAQVVMVTFVNGIAATASGNLLNMFQVDQIFKMSAGDLAKGTASATFLAGVAALAFSVIMLVTMLAFLFMITARMVMLWILIALSPFAFVLKILHQTEHYASQWWGQFGSNVVSGPIIAFFLWLSFVTVGSGTIHDEIKQHNALDRGLTLEGGSAEEETIGITNITSWDKMANFIIAVAILLAGAKVAQELGVAGAGMMSSAGELGKKVAMYASGYKAARWLAPKVGKGLYYGSAMIPGLNAIHPEAWKRRAGNVASKAKSWYYDRLAKSTVRAGDISKAFAVNRKGQYITGEKVKIAKKDKDGKVLYELDENGKEILDENNNKKIAYEEEKDKDGNIIKDDKGNIVYKKEDVLQKGFVDWAKRWMARGELQVAPGFSAFHKAYSEDLEATAEAKHEQLDHLASTSSLPIGLEKQKAKEWLEFLEHTGGDIKAGKKADMDQLREQIMQTIHHGTDKKEIEKDLRELGLDSTEIFKAMQGASRFDKSMKAKAKTQVIGENVAAEHKKEEQKALKEYLQAGSGYKTQLETASIKAGTKQIEERLQSEKELEELESIRRLLESSNQKKTTTNKAEIEQINFDINQIKELALARSRDQYLKDNFRNSEANNEQSILVKQAKERIDKQSVGTDYPRSLLRTQLLFEDKNKAKEEAVAAAQALAKLKGSDDKAAIAKAENAAVLAETKHKQIAKSLSEMQIGNWEQHGGIGEGNMHSIVKLIDPKLLQGFKMDAKDPASIQKMQAAVLSSLLGERVDPSKINEGVQKFESLHGDKSQALFEQLRLALDKGAGVGVFSVAGLLKNKLDSKTGGITTGVTESTDSKYIEGRRENARTTAKITTISAGLGGAVDIDINNNSVIESDEAVGTVASLLGSLTSTRLDSVDEFVKSSLAGIIEHSTDKSLEKLEGKLKAEGATRDRGAVATLLQIALGKTTDKIKKENKELIEKLIIEFNAKGSTSGKTS